MTTMPGAERRLHPLTILFELAGSLRQIAIPFVVVFLVAQPGRSGERQLIMPIVLLAITGVVAVARYLSYSYRYDASELVIRSGIFVRNERHIPYDRIQNIDAVQKLGHRLVGMVAVQVQTGAGTEPEATLSVLPLAALAEMRERVFSRRTAAAAVQATMAAPNAAAESSSSSTAEAPAFAGTVGASRVPAAPGRTLLALPLRELVLSGFIDNRGLVLILGAMGLVSQVDPLADLATERIAAWLPGISRADFAVARLGETRTLLIIAAAVVALLLFVRVLSTVWAAIRLYDFKLTRSGDDLRMEYGAFTRVSATISLRRVQTIAIHETVLHRMLGRAAMRVSTAGGGGGTSGSAEREWLAPIVHRAQLPMLLEELHPGLALDAITWRGAHPRAFGRIARTSVAIALAITGALAFFIGKWAIVVGALLVARALIRSRSYIRHLGWSILRDGVAFRGGFLRRRTTVAGFSRVQAVAVAQSPLDRRSGMADIIVDTAAAPLGLAYLAREDAEELEGLLVARAAGTEFTW